MPSLHVIAAGSLLEFSIREEDFSFPVGRVQFAHLYPLSFEEFLDACGDGAIREALSSYDCTSVASCRAVAARWSGASHLCYTQTS